MSIKRKQLTKATRAELIRMHGNKCRYCGSTENIEWHHATPLFLGGEDTLENMLPVCYFCHKIQTRIFMAVANETAKREKTGGRPALYPKNYDAILEDYTRCRISKSEAAKRLGKPSVRFNGEKFLREYLRVNKISKYKNNIDIYMSKHDYIMVGQRVGRIEYTNGLVEDLFWKTEQPRSGESSIPTREEFVPQKRLDEEDKKPYLESPRIDEDWWESYRKEYKLRNLPDV